MGQKRTAKATAQFKHAQRRASERYGIILTRHRYEELVRKIQSQQGVFLGRQSNRLSVWQVEAMAVGELGDDVPVKANVVYDRERKTVVTFLPKGISDARGVAIPPEQLND